MAMVVVQWLLRWVFFLGVSEKKGGESKKHGQIECKQNRVYNKIEQLVDEG